MARRDDSPDFIEAIARGLDVIRVFKPGQRVMSLAAVAAASDLPRPTARRILLTLEQLCYVRLAESSGYELTPRVLDLGMSYVLSRGLWLKAPPPIPDPLAYARLGIWQDLHRELATRSPQGEVVVAIGSGHYIQNDEPQLVIDAIRRVVARARVVESAMISVGQGSRLAT